MGYLRKIKGSPFWQAVFANGHGIEIQRSTKAEDKRKAEQILATWIIEVAFLRNKALCAARVRRVSAELSRLAAEDCSKMATTAEYAHRFLLVTRTALEPSTYRNRRRCVDLFINYLEETASLPLEDITKPQIAGFRDYLLEKGETPQAVKQRIEVLHTMFNFAIEDGVIEHNPCDGIVVKLPKVKGKEAKTKRKALSYAEGLRIVENATTEELVAVVLGFDLGARVGDAFGVQTDKLDLNTGRITFWVEKADCWHTIDVFPPTLLFLKEYVLHHRIKNGSPLLLPILGVLAGPEVERDERDSQLSPAFRVIRNLMDIAGCGEWITRETGSSYNTAAYHCFRITNDNALKMAGISTEWVMWRLCQKDEKSNKAYDRFSADNGKKAIFGKLGWDGGGASHEQGVKLDADGSMTFEEMMKLIDNARQKLIGCRLGSSPKTPE